MYLLLSSLNKANFRVRRSPVIDYYRLFWDVLLLFNIFQATRDRALRTMTCQDKTRRGGGRRAGQTFFPGGDLVSSAVYPRSIHPYSRNQLGLKVFCYI